MADILARLCLEHSKCVGGTTNYLCKVTVTGKGNATSLACSSRSPKQVSNVKTSQASNTSADDAPAGRPWPNEMGVRRDADFEFRLKAVARLNSD